MTDTTAWAHLPNAKHIDRILADLAENPDTWDVAYNITWTDAYYDARDSAREVGIAAGRDDVWTIAWYVIGPGARSAIFALIAYDDCGYLLDEKPEDVKMLALLGNNAAILIYPACVSLQKETS